METASSFRTCAVLNSFTSDQPLSKGSERPAVTQVLTSQP